MREEPPRKSWTGEPPDLGFIRQAAYDRALQWGVHDLDADDIADAVRDRAERRRQEDPAFLPTALDVRRWVSRVVQRRVLNLIEYGRRHVPIEDVPEPELVARGAVSVQPDEEEEEEPDPRLAAMDAIAQTMRPRWREVWALMKEDLRPAAIAPKLDINVRTVNKYVELIHRTMREALAAEGEQQERDEP